MLMRELVQYGFPEPLVKRWVEELGDELLPVQSIALDRYGILDGGRLFVSAPTSSGKTWLAELVAVHYGLRGKKVLILVPLRALAEERAIDLSSRYSEYGLDVSVTSRDRREDDERILRGEINVVVAVYEKAMSLLLRNPDLLRQLDLVVADELQILNDEDRGPDAEMLLSLIRSGAPQANLLALSAVIGDPETVAGWLQARLLEVKKRPVPLRRGVLYRGVYRYITDEGIEGEEDFPEVRGESWDEMLIQAVQACVARGEQVLVFLPRRAETRRWAARLSEVVNLPSARRTVEALEPLQETGSRNLLLRTLRSGVAFHNGDLLAEERWAVEAGMRNGEIRVVVATTTLASGVNLPAKTVIVSPTAWSGSRRSKVFSSPITQFMFEAMSGRAGRLRLQDEFGRAILLAPKPFHRDSLWRYMVQPCEPVMPRLMNVPLERPVLTVLAAGLVETEEEIRSWLQGTLSGRKGWAKDPELAERIRRVISRGKELGLIREFEEGRPGLTSPGKAVARSGQDLNTMSRLAGWLSSMDATPTSLEILFAVCMLPGTTTVPVPLSREEYVSGRYERRVWAEWILRVWRPGDGPAERIPRPDYDEVRACKLAVVLQEWLEGVPTAELESTHGMSAGTIARAAEEVAFVLQGLLDFARETGKPEHVLRAMEDLVARLPYGVRHAGLELARLRVRGLERDHIHRLVRAGFEDPRSIKEVPVEVLAKVVPVAIAERLLARVRDEEVVSPPVAGPAVSSPILVLDPSTPGTVRYRGRIIYLTPAEYRLLSILARSPQRCVPYEQLYRDMWGSEGIGDRERLFFHKRRLLKKLTEAGGGEDNLPVEALPGQGLVLSLPEEAVMVLRR